MKLRLLLFILYQKLKSAAKKNAAYRSFLGNMRVKIMIKTADGKHGRLFIFDRGKLSTLTGATHPYYDAAIIWSDPNTAFKVLSSRSDEQTFKAAADGKLKVDGMVAYVQWFTDGVKLVMK
jgi:hypothetical protein